MSDVRRSGSPEQRLSGSLSGNSTDFTRERYKRQKIEAVPEEKLSQPQQGADTIGQSSFANPKGTQLDWTVNPIDLSNPDLTQSTSGILSRDDGEHGIFPFKTLRIEEGQNNPGVYFMNEARNLQVHFALDVLREPTLSLKNKLYTYLGNLVPGSRGAQLDAYIDNIKNRNITDEALYGHWRIKVVESEHTS